MIKLFSKFRRRETLILIIPGIYFVSLLFPLQNNLNVDLNNNIVANAVLFPIFALLFGLILYWLDIPKKMPFFKKNLPTTKLYKDYPNEDKTLIDNTYFKFYSGLSKELLDKTDLYTSLYHFCINMSVSSLLLGVVYCIFDISSFQNLGYGSIAIIIFFISFICALGLFYGKRKVKYMFNRQYEDFKISDLGKTLQNNHKV